MYRGFNLKPCLTLAEIEKYHSKGKEIFESHKKQVKAVFDKFKLKDGSLDGSAIQATWFPQIEADVFISHSHKNEKEVIALAGFLMEKFKIKAFIDSCIWESAYDLQQDLDNIYSWIDPLKKGSYSYSEVSNSSSHVHMMLSSALALMIDRTECIFFYNTPDSIETYDKIKRTSSPWIYSEITITQIVRRKIPARRKTQEIRLFAKGGLINESLKMKYRLETGHLANLTPSNFNAWKSETTNTPNEALDKLYNLIPLRGLTISI